MPGTQASKGVDASRLACPSSVTPRLFVGLALLGNVHPGPGRRRARWPMSIGRVPGEPHRDLVQCLAVTSRAPSRTAQVGTRPLSWTIGLSLPVLRILPKATSWSNVRLPFHGASTRSASSRFWERWLASTWARQGLLDDLRRTKWASPPTRIGPGWTKPLIVLCSTTSTLKSKGFSEAARGLELNVAGRATPCHRRRRRPQDALQSVDVKCGYAVVRPFTLTAQLRMRTVPRVQAWGESPSVASGVLKGASAHPPSSSIARRAFPLQG